MKKILVIDGNSIINRAFYGIRPLTTKSGKHTNAIYGMISIILKQLDSIRPDYAAVAFDLKAPTFRHEMFKDYKAGRTPTPQELLEQFPDAKECLSLLGFHVLEMPGYEADDIQGTVASFAHTSEDTESFILTGDRDLLQLIDDKITVLLATNNDTKVMKEAEFFEKYGISPSLFVEMKALMGDSSDNIPGVRGIGEKTAASLIKDFGRLESIYENINDSKIKESVRTKLTLGESDAYLSRKLAKIDTAVPLGRNLESLEYRGFDYQGLYKKFTELELNSFIAKLKLLENSKNCGCEIENTKSDSVLFCETLKDITEDDIASISSEKIALQSIDSTFYIYDGKCCLKYSGDIKDLSPLFAGERDIICYDAKTLWHRLDYAGVEISHAVKFLDIMLYGYVINPGGAVGSLSSLISEFLEETVEENTPCPSLLFELEGLLREKIKGDGGEKILDEIELPLIKVLAEIEKCGFMIDSEGMTEYAVALDGLAKDLQEKIYFQAGGEFNINSPKQLGEVLFVKLGLPYKKKKNKNGFSTDAETLESLRPYSEIIDDILEYRQVTKLKGTYAAQLPKLADNNGRIHTDFKQALTATGRLSSADPNLQNIPIRTKMGRQMRKYFIAKPGYTLVDADYSQIELRILAHISDDYNMQKNFEDGADIHRKTAAAVFGVEEDFVSDEMRKRAKAVNFGIVYGISGFSLAKDIGTSVAEASKYIKNYLMNYPRVEEYLEKVVEDAKALGYTTTLLGRRRYIPELSSSNGMMKAFGKRIAMNAPIQGTAADIMKIAMIKVANRLSADAPESKIVMQVHDELVIEAPLDERDKVVEILKEEMTDAVKLKVPLPIDITCGKNWLEQT